MPYSIGDQIAGAVHQGLPSGADANTAQLIAIMQMLSKAGEHTRDIAQWWEQRPERKARRDEALRDILFQEVASGRKPPEALEHSPEEMAKYLKLNQVLNQYTPENISAAVGNIRIGGRLASSLPAGTEDSAAEATMGEVDNILSSAIRDAKTRTSVSEDIEKSVSKTIQSFSMSNPAETAALYIKAMQLYEANPNNIDSLSPAQQAIIAETSKNGDTAKTILNRLQGLTYTVDKNEKSSTKGVMKVTPLLDKLTGQDKVLQTKIIAHIESKTGGATLDKKLDVYNNLFPQEEASGKFWNPYSEKFQSKSDLAKELDSNEGLRLWAIQTRLANEKQSLPDKEVKSTVGTFLEGAGSAAKDEYGVDPTGTLPFMNQNSLEGIGRGIGKVDQAVRDATGYVEQQAGKARDAIRDSVGNIVNDIPKAVDSTLDYIPTLPEMPKQSKRLSIPSGGMDAMSGDYPMRRPVDNGLGNVKDLNLDSLSEQEQRALLDLLMKMKSGVGAQQSPASMQYPGMGYGLRVR